MCLGGNQCYKAITTQIRNSLGVILKQKTLLEFKYTDIQESFGFGGPYLGALVFQGKLIEGTFLADNEKISQDNLKIVFSKFNGFTKTGLFGFRKKRDFKILVYDQQANSFYQSIKSFEALSIENISKNQITYHMAFHTELNEYKRQIEFNEQNFVKIKNDKIEFKGFDQNFVKAILNELEIRLNRKLTESEIHAFTIKRSGIAYEMILDFISNDNITSIDLEKYVHGVVKEVKTNKNYT